MTKITQLAERTDEYANVELWLHDNDLLVIMVSLDEDSFALETTNGKEAMDMYRHPFAYRKEVQNVQTRNATRS